MGVNGCLWELMGVIWLINWELLGVIWLINWELLGVIWS